MNSVSTLSHQRYSEASERLEFCWTLQLIRSRVLALNRFPCFELVSASTNTDSSVASSLIAVGEIWGSSEWKRVTKRSLCACNFWFIRPQVTIFSLEQAFPNERAERYFAKVVLLILESLGSTELVFILVMALVFFGPRKLPQISRSLGKNLAEFRRASEEFKRTWDREVTLDDGASANNSALPGQSSILDPEKAGQALPAPNIVAVPADQVIALRADRCTEPRAADAARVVVEYAADGRVLADTDVTEVIKK